MLDKLGSGSDHEGTLPSVTRLRKHVVARSYVTRGNIIAMSDEEDLAWTRLSEPWERLTWARSRDPRYPTKKAFAAAVGLGEHGYAAYERAPDTSKHVPLTEVQAIPWGKRLKVRWEWLMGGPGQPWIRSSDRTLSAAQERATELLDGKPEEQQERIVAALEMLLRTGTK